MFHDNLYMKCFGKMVKIIYLADSVDEANHFIEGNPNYGVLKEVGQAIFIAKNEDLGKDETEL